MCGIVGIISKDPSLISPEVLEKMTTQLRHRGPDGQGIWICRSNHLNIGLGHTRLAIIDLSEKGRQPMANEDGSLQVVFNGEIYNFLDLRGPLLEKGHTFRSRTDTEVLLHLYEEKGVRLLDDLRGMFAFAIWDGREKRLLLARDRLGKKPLFYYQAPELFIFASEAKAILAHPAVRAEVDPGAILYFLTYGYVPSPLCAFKGMRKLPPAHALIFDGENLTTSRYWQVHFEPRIRRPAEQILETLEEAVKLRLISDVPLGAFLSGGIDSSAVVALMAKLTPGKVKTFSIGFEEQEYNEVDYARRVARRFSTDHQELVVRPRALDVLPKLVWHYDEPYGDSSALPTYYVSKVTREHVTVALNGDAGDENFAGYDRYVATCALRFLQPLPRIFPRLLGTGIRAAASLFSSRLSYNARRFGSTLHLDPLAFYVRLMSHFDQEALQELCRPDFLSSQKEDPYHYLSDLAAQCKSPHFLDKLLYIDLHSYLPEDLLVKVDRASMAVSLEARSPFLDHKLVELAAAIPPDLKLRRLQKKYILKRALEGTLPREILQRRKMGFGVPLEDWFRTDLYELTADLFSSRSFRERGYFKDGAARKMLEEHKRGRRRWHAQLWDLLILELWHQRFIDQETV